MLMPIGPPFFIISLLAVISGFVLAMRKGAGDAKLEQAGFLGRGLILGGSVLMMFAGRELGWYNFTSVTGLILMLLTGVIPGAGLPWLLDWFKKHPPKPPKPPNWRQMIPPIRGRNTGSPG
ncbi:MAG: hypothetical protein EAZ89_21095 [Bacteroidetes bacterium]|nr:MAG: hypothetical protein EAZ89_21095 [Bacteroidota bacterium]